MSLNRKSDTIKSFLASKIGQLALYGGALGLLTAALQVARFRLIYLDQAQEMFTGLIAGMFMVLGIWAGWRLSHRRQAATPPVSSGEVQYFAPDKEKVQEALGITPREFDVLEGIALGLSNQEIAERMYVSLNTVKTHTSNLFSKLDVQRRTQAVQKAQLLGLLPTVKEDAAAGRPKG